MWPLNEWFERRKTARIIRIRNALRIAEEREKRAIDLAMTYRKHNSKLALDNRELRAELRGVKSTITMLFESTPLWPAIQTMIGDKNDGAQNG